MKLWRQRRLAASNNPKPIRGSKLTEEVSINGWGGLRPTRYPFDKKNAVDWKYEEK